VLAFLFQHCNAYSQVLTKHNIRFDGDQSNHANNCRWHTPFRDVPSQNRRSLLLYGGTKQDKDTREGISIHGRIAPDRNSQHIVNSSESREGSNSNNKYIVPLVITGAGLTIAALGHYVDLDYFSDMAVKFLADAGPYGYVYFAMVITDKYVTGNVDNCNHDNTRTFTDIYTGRGAGDPCCTSHGLQWVLIRTTSRHLAGAVQLHGGCQYQLLHRSHLLEDVGPRIHISLVL